MSARQLLFAVLAAVTLISTALSQDSQTKPPLTQDNQTKPSFLIVDSTKVDPAVTYTTQKMKFLASSAETGGVTTVFESIEMPGYKTNIHRHNNAEETFYILEGVLTVMLGGKRHDLGPGSYVFIPRGTTHAQGNLTAKPVRFITTVTPGGIEEFFRDRSELLKVAKPGEKDYESRYAEVLQRHKKWIEILGPWTPEKPQ